MKKTFYLIATAILTVMFVSCEEKEPTGPAVNDDLAFTLELDSVDATSAKIKVSHNGTKEDTWFGFATTEKDPLDSVEDLVADIIAEGGRISLKKSVQSTFSVKDLTPETDYTFVVVGLTDAGEVYGFPNSIEFTTGRDLSKLAEDKERWKISYERTEYKGEKCEGVTIECADEEIYYFEAQPAADAPAQGANREIADAHPPGRSTGALSRDGPCQGAGNIVVCESGDHGGTVSGSLCRITPAHLLDKVDFTRGIQVVRPNLSRS